MDLLIVTLRLLHVVGGAVWVGMMVFMVAFLVPAIADSGPEGGKVMTAVQRRGLLTAIPVIALVTILSGLLLYWRVSAGFAAAFIRSPTGLTLAVGAAAAVLAFLIGIAVTRPAMLRAAALAQRAAASAEAERAPLLAEAQRHRTRGIAVSRLVVLLLVLATAAMAVARYV